MTTLWKILRAEIDYNRLFLLGFHLFSAVCFIVIWYGVKFERNRAPLILMILMVSTYMVAYIKENRPVRGSRFRMFAALPVSLRSIGIERLLFPLFYFMSLLALLFVVFACCGLVSNSDLTIPPVTHFLYVGGLILIVTALYYMANDMKVMTRHRIVQAFFMFTWLMIYLVVFAQFYVIINFFGLFDGVNTPGEFILQFMGRWFVVILILAAGVLLSLISLNVFHKRKSYL